MTRTIIAAILALGLLSQSAYADVPGPADRDRITALVEEALELDEEERGDSEALSKLSAMLGEFFPRVEVTGLRQSPLENLVEVEINQAQYVYATRDFSYLLAGEMMEMRETGPVSLAEERREEARSRFFRERLDPDTLISFRADEEKGEVYVFTDPTCGYCQRMHRQMDQYNERGITVHYLAFPRDGGAGQITDQLETIWCADSQHRAMDQAKLENRITESSSDCDHPVQEHYRMGQEIGVSGTPGTFDGQGRQHGGYLSPADLAAALGID